LCCTHWLVRRVQFGGVREVSHRLRLRPLGALRGLQVLSGRRLQGAEVVEAGA